jgi:hypothetical protein
MTEIDTTKLDELGYLERAARTYARHESNKRLRRYRNQAIIGFLILAAGIGFAIKDQHDTSQRARQVVCQIITRGDKQAYIYTREGVINSTQLHRALTQSAEDRKLLDANCDTGITPPPTHVGVPGRAAPVAPHGRAGGG